MAALMKPPPEIDSDEVEIGNNGRQQGQRRKMILHVAFSSRDALLSPKAVLQQFVEVHLLDFLKLRASIKARGFASTSFDQRKIFFSS